MSVQLTEQLGVGAAALDRDAARLRVQPDHLVHVRAQADADAADVGVADGVKAVAAAERADGLGAADDLAQLFHVQRLAPRPRLPAVRPGDVPRPVPRDPPVIPRCPHVLRWWRLRAEPDERGQAFEAEVERLAVRQVREDVLLHVPVDVVPELGGLSLKGK